MQHEPAIYSYSIVPIGSFKKVATNSPSHFSNLMHSFRMANSIAILFNTIQLTTFTKFVVIFCFVLGH